MMLIVHHKRKTLLIKLQFIVWYCDINLHISPFSIGLRFNVYRLLIEHDNDQYIMVIKNEIIDAFILYNLPISSNWWIFIIKTTVWLWL